MKILLLQDVPKLGRKYEITEVKDGYGLNYLLPSGLARVATDSVVREYSERKKRHEEALAKREEELLETLSSLEDASITITAKANEQGHLFAGVSTEDIQEAVQKELDLNIDERNIALEHPIKDVGEYEIPLTLAGKEATLALIVEAEKE